ncbi:MAG: MoxR family ATPase [Gemmatimonadetes bacterium]|nr:MoxR family ATPase [Gemmatimonadota bacterium]
MKTEIAEMQAAMERLGYIAEPEIATAVYLAQRMRRPLLIEGDAGVGKTEIAKVMATSLGTELIRLQCYEGLDVNTALYEWDYQRQLLRLRMVEVDGRTPEELEHVIFSRDFLLERPLLRAITRPDGPPVLLVDEIDRADDGFEAFLLELLSDYQVTIPELGTISATHVPYVVLTSNRSREIGDALRRRCLYLYVAHPTLEKEVRIIKSRVPRVSERLATEIAAFVQGLRTRPLSRMPGAAETIDWAAALVQLHGDHLEAETVAMTLGCILKGQRDVADVDGETIGALLEEARAAVGEVG